MFKIKFCGIKDKETALSLIDNFKDYELLFGLRIGKRRHYSEITIEEAQEIIEEIKDKSLPVISTYLKNSDKIIELCKNFHTKWIQVSGFLDSQELSVLKNYNIILTLDVSKIDFGKNNNKNLEAYNLIIIITNSFYPDWDKISITSSYIPYEKIFIGGWLHHENMLYAIKHVLPSGINIDLSILNYTFGSIKNLKRYIETSQKIFELFANSNNWR